MSTLDLIIDATTKHPFIGMINMIYLYAISNGTENVQRTEYSGIVDQHVAWKN